MSLSLYFPYSLSTTAGNVPLEDLKPFGPWAPEPAAGAYEHWILGGGAPSLSGIRYGRQLTPQSSGHVWSDKYVTLPGTGNALLTPLADGGARTMMLAVRLPAGAAYSGPIMCGAWAGTYPARTGSALFFISSIAQPSVIVEGAIGQYLARTTPTGAGDGSWIILGLSEDLGTYPGGKQLTYVRHAGNGPPGWSAYDGTGITAAKAIDATKKIAFGNAYQAIYNYYPTVIAEGAVWDRYLDGDELEAAGDVFARNMTNRGLTPL